jgi:hypothetical protein
MKAIIAVLYLIAFVGGIGSGVLFLLAMNNSPILRSDEMFLTIGIAVIPYCIARSFDGFAQKISEK